MLNILLGENTIYDVLCKLSGFFVVIMQLGDIIPFVLFFD